MAAGGVPAFESVSTWRQPVPAALSAERADLIAVLAERVDGLGTGRLRVAIDGYTAAGKTSFGHELAEALRERGRPTLRASFDDFKNPWRDARRLGYDRLSGEGYYRNAYDFRSARELLLGPAGPEGSGRVVLCAHDPLTGEDHRDYAIESPADAVLIVDSVFAFRPEYNDPVGVPDLAGYRSGGGLAAGHRSGYRDGRRGWGDPGAPGSLSRG